MADEEDTGELLTFSSALRGSSSCPAQVGDQYDEDKRVELATK
jgi:hypothetical protein